MTPTEVTTILRQFNEWRRGDKDLPQFDLYKVNAAIYAAIEMIERAGRVEKALAELIADLEVRARLDVDFLVIADAL